MRYVSGILHLVSFLAAALALVFLVHCLGTGQDLLALYWGAIAMLALRFVLALPESD